MTDSTRDRAELLNIEGMYAPYYDAMQGNEWAALFTEDGIYESREDDGTPPIFKNFIQGRENLARFCSSQRASGIHTLHVPDLTITGDAATGTTHFQFSQLHVTGSVVHLRATTGYYDVRYVREPDGWRIRRRVTTYVSLSQRTLAGYPLEPGF